MRCRRKILATKMHAQIAFSCGGFRLRCIPDAPLALIYLGACTCAVSFGLPCQAQVEPGKDPEPSETTGANQKMGCPVRPFVAIGQTVPLFFGTWVQIQTHQKTCTFSIFGWLHPHVMVQDPQDFGKGRSAQREDASARHFLVAEAQQKTSAELGAINGVATKGEMEPMAELEIGV